MPLTETKVYARQRGNQLRALARQALVVAIEEIGRGESGGNNVGEDVVRYRGGKGGRGSWCAAFVCWTIEQAAMRLKLDVPIERTHGAKALARRVADVGCWVEIEMGEWPLPGDVIAWHRGKQRTWRGHVGWVASYVPETDTMVTLEGNVGRFPATVQRFEYRAGRWRKRLYGIARLA